MARRPLNDGVHSAFWRASGTTWSGSSAPGWHDDNAARRDAGTREPGGHYSGVS
jgi:hypothetical protein